MCRRRGAGSTQSCSNGTSPSRIRTGPRGSYTWRHACRQISTDAGGGEDMSTINGPVGCALILALGVLSSGGLVLAQQDKTRTNSRILYHNGYVVPREANVYVIWYGCWRCGYPGSDAETQTLL